MAYTLSPELEQRVQAKLSSGEYTSADALLADALSALDELQSRHAELRASIQARMANVGKGLAQPLDVEEFLAEARHSYSNPATPTP